MENQYRFSFTENAETSEASKTKSRKKNLNFYETNFASTSRCQYDDIEMNRNSTSSLHDQDIDDYFNLFASQRGLLKSSSNDSLNSYFNPFSNEKFKTNNLVSDMECETCKNLILRKGNRRCSMCGDCIEKLYSPKICSICKGRISFLDLKHPNLNIDKNLKRRNDFTSTKLCNCFPKYPSQHLSSIQPNEPNEVQILPSFRGRYCSFDDISLTRQQKRFQRNSALYSSQITLKGTSVFEESNIDNDENSSLN